jgi:hypothetical protein
MKKLLLVATCVALMAPALAYAAGVDDPDDTAGRLDIKYTGSHVEGSRDVFEVEMFRAWSNRLVRERGHITAFFNTRKDARAEWKLEMVLRRGSWTGEVCGHTGGRGARETIRPVCHRARVWRSEATSIEFSIRPDQILKDADNSYTWRAKTKLRFAKGCAGTEREYCIDASLGKQAD